MCTLPGQYPEIDATAAQGGATYLHTWGWAINPLMETRLTSEISLVAKTKTNQEPTNKHILVK
jgi:hypothetical protein